MSATVDRAPRNAGSRLERIDAALLPSRLQHGLTLHHASITGERLLPVVRCSTADAAGYGEAPPLVTFTGEDAEDTLRQVRAFAPRLLGLEPAKALDLLHSPDSSLGTSARAALDVALHDLAARLGRVPLHELLAPNALPAVRISRAIGLHDVDKTVELARGYAGRGISALKLKVGRDTDTDAAVVGAVRAAVGPETELSVDANEGLSADAAVELVEACRGLDLAYFEQPVRRDDHAGLRRVRQAGIKVMVDESLFGADDARALLDADAADLFAIKLIKCGGLRPALEIAEVARQHDIPVLVIDPLGSAVSLNAGLHLAAVLPDKGFAHGLSAGLDVTAPHAPHLSIVDGFLSVPPRPGLGTQVNWPDRPDTPSSFERSRT